MLLRFLSAHDGYEAGDVKDIEITLARRLVGIGKAEYRTDPAVKKSVVIETADNKKAEVRNKADVPPIKNKIIGKQNKTFMENNKK